MKIITLQYIFQNLSRTLSLSIRTLGRIWAFYPNYPFQFYNFTTSRDNSEEAYVFLGLHFWWFTLGMLIFLVFVICPMFVLGALKCYPQTPIIFFMKFSRPAKICPNFLSAIKCIFDYNPNSFLFTYSADIAIWSCDLISCDMTKWRRGNVFYFCLSLYLTAMYSHWNVTYLILNSQDKLNPIRIYS